MATHARSHAVRHPWPFMSTFDGEPSLAEAVRFLRRRGAHGATRTTNHWRLSYESRVNRDKREREGRSAFASMFGTLQH